MVAIITPTLYSQCYLYTFRIPTFAYDFNGTPYFVQQV